MSKDWLSLSSAAKLLGVHPSTVRLWSNKGLLPVQVTSGGHRRYKRSEVELWVEHARNRSDVAPEAMMQSAVRNVRMRITDGQLEAESWYQKLDGEARGQYRRSAHLLFQGLMSYLAANGNDETSEAHAIGYEYASRARRYDLNSTDATKAFIFFRRVLLESIIQVYQEANVPLGQAWGMLSRAHAFTDLVLLNMIETYQKLDAS
ncbi:MAG: MerR family DNA-binding transcriptional regulator [Chloroflexi bacterium]|nr:MerR family DNA-binding transcriptional regulator [Chloroflexota bacterium]MBI3338976.1 MerR family DNA-binding transcriptional regulator [Chloroflexota bacterium]